MKTNIALVSLLALTACAGGGSGGGKPTAVDNIDVNNIPENPLVLKTPNPNTQQTVSFKLDENNKIISVIDDYGEHPIDTDGVSEEYIIELSGSRRDRVTYNLKGHLVGEEGLQYSNFGTLHKTAYAYDVNPGFPNQWEYIGGDYDVFYGGDLSKQIEKPSNGEMTFEGRAEMVVSTTFYPTPYTATDAQLVLNNGNETLNASFPDWYDITITNNTSDGTPMATIGTKNYAWGSENLQGTQLTDVHFDTQYYGENGNITEAVAGASGSLPNNLPIEIVFGGKRQ